VAKLAAPLPTALEPSLSFQGWLAVSRCRLQMNNVAIACQMEKVVSVLRLESHKLVLAQSCAPFYLYSEEAALARVALWPCCLEYSPIHPWRLGADMPQKPVWHC